jgi:hypothetical protein
VVGICRASTVAAMVLAGLAYNPAQATVINFATGQNGSGVIQTTGDSLDANWKEAGAASPKMAPNSFVVAPNNADSGFPAWFANGPNSSWIAPNPDNANGNGNYSLTYTFDLTGDNLATAVFSGFQWAIDDAGNVQLNGHTEATLNLGSADWTSFHSFSPNTADLVQGINTLVINSTNSDTFLEAARLEGTLTISPATGVPEPTTLALFGTALAGFGLVRRRRKSA